MSLHYLAYLIVSCGYTVEPTRGDYGYDLSVFTFSDRGEYENGNMFVQLKATDKLKIDRKSKEDVVIRVDRRDVATWEAEPFPAYLVVFDAMDAVAYSVDLQTYFAAHAISAISMTTASLRISMSRQPLDANTIRGWRLRKNAVLTMMSGV